VVALEMLVDFAPFWTFRSALTINIAIQLILTFPPPTIAYAASPLLKI
jgi:hypothetical protein